MINRFLKNIQILRQNDKNESKPFEQLKDMIFYTFYQVLETRTLSENISIFIIVMNFLQLIAMTLNKANTDLSSTSISGGLVIADYILVYPAITGNNNQLFFSGFLFFGLFTQVFLIWGAVFIYKQEFQDDISIKEFKNVWAFIYDLQDKVLMIPYYGLAISAIFCEGSSDCSAPIHYVDIFTSLLLIIFLTINELFYLQLFFNFTFRIKDNLAKNPTNFQIFMFVMKIILIFIQVRFDIKTKETYIEYLIVHLINGFFLCYESLSAFPYHSKNVSKAHGIFCASYFWINGVFFVLYIIQEGTISSNILYIVGVGLGCFVKLYLNVRNYYAKEIVFSELEEIGDDILLDLKVRSFNHLFKTLHIKKSELLLASLLKIHYDKCKEKATCLCRNRNTLFDPKKREYGDQKLQLHKDNVFVKHFISKMISDGHKKFKQSMLLELNYMFYLYEALRLYTPLFQIIQNFKKKYENQINLSYEFCLYRLEQMVHHFIQNKNQKSTVSDELKIENVQIFDVGLKRLKDYVKQVAKQFQQIWECLQDNIPDLSKLLEICNDTSQKIATTNDLYEELKYYNQNSTELKILMEIYADQLVFDEPLYKKIQKEILLTPHMEIGDSINQDIDYLLKKYDIYDQNSCIISISSNIETMSQITWCSKNCLNVFGINEQNLKGRSINDFMPDVYSQHHDSILQNFYQKGKERSINNIMHTWAIDHKGFCFSCNIFVKIIPSLKNYEIISLIHKINDKDYIITDYDGQISGLGKKAADYLQLNVKKLKEQRLNIQLFAPKISDLYKDYFGDSEEPEEQNQVKISNQQLHVLGADNSQLREKEFKFYFFVPNDCDSLIEHHLNSKKRLLTKFFNDEDIQIKDISSKSKDITELIKFKSAYAEFIQRGILKLNKKRLLKIIKIKASVQFLQYQTMNNQTFRIKAIKIITIDSKTPQYATQERMQRQQKYLKIFIQDINQRHNDFKVKKLKKQQEEEQKEQEEQKKEEEEKEQDPKNKKSNQNKLMSLLKKIKPTQNGKKKNDKENLEEIDIMLKKRILEFFKPKKSLKYIKSARLKGYSWLKQNNPTQQKIPLPSQQDVNNQQSPEKNNLKPVARTLEKKTSIVLSNARPTAEQRNAFKSGKKQSSNLSKSVTTPIRQDKTRRSRVFDDESDDDNNEPEVSIRLAHRVRRALLNKGIIGIRERSLFYDPMNLKKRRESGQLFLLNSEEIIEGKKGTQETLQESGEQSKPQLTQLNAIQKLKKMFKEGKLHMNEKIIKEEEEFSQKKSYKSGNTIKTLKKIKDSSSSSENEDYHKDNIFDENQKFIEHRSDDSLIQERNLIDNLEKVEIKEEERAVAQSVGSTSSSLNAQNAVRILRQSLKNMETPRILQIANYTVIFMCVAVFCLSLSQFLLFRTRMQQLQDLYQIIGRISTYSENTIRFYYNYIDFYMVNQKYYDLNLYNQAWWQSNVATIKQNLYEFTNFELLDLSSAGQEVSGKTDLRAYLFQPMQYTMLVAKQPQVQDSNFESYLRLYINSINQTIDLPTTYFTYQNYLTNDYLFFIDQNKDEQIKQNILNMNSTNSMIQSQNNQALQDFIIQWSFTFFFIIFTFFVLYPIMLKSRIKIHESLVLFTRISLRDVDYYEDHYKKLHFFFNSIENVFYLMKEIEKFVESQALLLQKLKKSSDSRSIVRSRDYKGVKVDSLLFLLQISFVMILFLSFIALKDYKAIIFLTSLDTMKNHQITQHSVLYNNLVATCNYHELFKNIIDSNNSTQFNNDVSNFEFFLSQNSKLQENLMDSYSFFGQFQTSYKQFIQSLLQDSICTEVLTLTQSQLNQCQSLFSGVLNEGYVNFYITQQQYMKLNVDNLKQYLQTNGYDFAKLKASQMIKERQVYDMRYLYDYISNTTQLWYQEQTDAINQGISDQINYNMMLLIFFDIFIFLFVILVWWKVFYDLKRDSQWVNSFILLIPIQLHRENQYLRSYLKKKLNLNNFGQ
ncbi:PAS domain S-box protein, putative (macronuclear) [Tetrahymena thermophila SB210]|uniref:PAS domain S-box protein, putative n=1 Tax=Tetrahymena thermophila (strain SB210) TaxID=312017 RepID=Q22V23_TETTS|nr:PAS domain S-box protein, putative [Tetrahymena thermophila SB210]EAR89125.2 PAS domain S-box protein, putative [Tetrahymena thermophila SB210]|eukprot:XP_001009370.2 PAS domain S-box protein, putative [Tetrahymena thermophila SB210]